MILNNVKVDTRGIRLFAVHPDVFNLFSVVNSILTKIHLKAWMRFPISGKCKSVQKPHANLLDTPVALTKVFNQVTAHDWETDHLRAVFIDPNDLS
jgi:hypothetical protein